MKSESDRERLIRMTVLLPRVEFNVFDAYCNENGFKKSTLVKRLIKEHLANVSYQHQADLPLSLSDRDDGEER